MSINRHLLLCGLGFFSLLLLWFVEQVMHATINHDLFWLQTGFFRLLDGQTMTQGFYETNPPLSALIYAPVFLLAQTPLGLMYAMLLVGIIAVILSVLATYKIIRGWDFMTRRDAIFTAAMLLVAGTIMTRPEFGQRDHLIALGAVPLCCLLLTRTWAWSTPVRGPFAVTVLVMGTLALLLKPYYGLLPAFLIIHRIITRKSMKVVFDSDILIMAAVTTVYAAVIWYAFPDYLTMIMPDLPQLYAATGARFDVDKTVLLLINWTYLWMLTCHPHLKSRKSGWSRVLLTLAALSMLIYIIMNKGYAYHLIPFLTFTLLAAALLLQEWLTTKGRDPEKTIPWLVLGLTALITMIPSPYYPAADTIKTQEVTKIVAGCGDDCRFLMLGAPVRVIQHISAYADKPHASRFSKDWFVEGLLQQEKQRPGDPEIAALKLKYAGLIAEDISSFKPQILLACHAMTERIKYFSVSPQFRDQLKNYEYTKTVDLYPEAFFIRQWRQPLKPVPCDIYKRR